MSAWIVSQTHINAIVSAAMRFEIPYKGQPVTLANAAEVGADLWNENHASINYRYDEHDTAEPYTFSPVDLETVSLYKQVQCYNYQTCEHPTYEQSAAYRLVEDLTAALVQSIGKTAEQIDKLPAYDAAPWGLDDPQPAYVPDTVLVPVAIGAPELPEPISLPAWRLRQMRESEHTVKDCEGCRAAILTGDKFCANCGADLNDLFGRILATTYECVTPFNADPEWTRQGKAAMAKDTRAWFKAMGWTGATAKVTSRGVYSCQVDVYLPEAHPIKADAKTSWDREECDHDMLQYGINGRDCAKCARRWAAIRHLESLCYAAFPAASNRTDSQSDYFCQTFGIGN